MIAALPGLSWIWETPDSLILFLPHGELRIAGGELSRVVEAILERAIDAPTSAGDLVDAATRRCDVREAIARYALRLLEEARCLRECDSDTLPGALDWLFWSRSGTSTISERIPAAMVHCLCYDDGCEALERSLSATGLGYAIEQFTNGSTSASVAVRLTELATDCDVVLVVGPRYSHPFTRALARAAVELDVPVLFVETGGLVARVGPTLLGRDLPCLDCLNARHAANGGVPLNRAVDDLSTAGPIELPPPPLVPPNLRALAFELAAIELCRIVLSENFQTFGGYIEAEWRGEVRRRAVHRVPLCAGCAEVGIERFPYHVTPITA